MAPLSSDRLALLRAALAEKGLAAPRAGALPRRATRGRAPLSSAQERLFFLELYEPGTALYNDALRVTLAGPLEPARLARAVADVAARHEILRTGFALGAEGPEQRIFEGNGECSVPELRVLGPLADEAGALALAHAEACRPFELEQPPWRVALAPLGEERWVLVLTMHHILSDGASMGLFLDELAARYSGGAAPAPLALQFGDFAAWERAQRDEARLAADRAYWRAALAGELTSARWSAAVGPASRTGAQARVELDAGALADLGALARGWQATSSQLLLAAWLALLAAESDATAPCTGIASSLRTRRELEPLIGFFVQSLPLRVELGGDPSFAELVERVRAAALAAQAHAALPFEEILACAGGAAAQGRKSAAPPQTFFSHMKDAIRAPALPGVEAGWEFVDAGVARFELALVLHESAAGLTGFLEHDLGLFPPAEGERLARAYERLVRAVSARPTERLSVLAPVRRPGSAPRALRRAQLPSTRLRRAAGDGA
jgi:condensation domain-containing protein